MDNNILSHRRFQKKMEQDLHALYEQGNARGFIMRFKEYERHHPASTTLTEYFYKSLGDEGRYDDIIDYSLIQMNEGFGNYDLHMKNLLEALLSQGRYYEVIEFSDQLMQEELPQEFRIEVAALRHRAKKALDDKEVRPNESYDETYQDMDEGSFREMPLHARLDFLKHLMDTGNGSYRMLIKSVIDSEQNLETITFMLLYLKMCGEDQAVRFHKMGSEEEAIPTLLPDIEETEMYVKVRNDVLEHLEDRMPEFAEAADSMLIAHIIGVYPLDPPYDYKSLADAYLHELLRMVNVDSGTEPTPEVLEWVRSIERLMSPSD